MAFIGGATLADRPQRSAASRPLLGLSDAPIGRIGFAANWRRRVEGATGGKIADACGLLPTIVEGLIDLDYREWQGKTHEEVKKHWPQLYELWKTSPHLARFPSGESLRDITLRTADAFRGAVHDFPDDSDTVALVGHDRVNRGLLLQLLDQPLSAYWKIAQDPCCINVIKYEDGAIRALSINETQHTKSLNIRKKPTHPEVILRLGPQLKA